MPTKLKKQEEIGSLPDKEIRIMMVKKIQNLEHRIELQISRLETRVNNMEEILSKDLEETRCNQY